MDFGFSEEQEMLRRTARGMLEKECPTSVVRKLMDDARGYDQELWKTLGSLGWLGLVLPEEFGGAGLSYVDLVLVLEEMGRVLLPAPFISTVVFAETIRRGASPVRQRELLPKIAKGDLVGTLAYMEASGSYGADGIVMPARREGNEFVLEGQKLFVPDAHVADYMTVATRTAGQGTHGITLFAIDGKRAGLTLVPLKTMDQTCKLFEVRFDGVRATADDLLGDPDRGWRILGPVIDRGKLMVAAEMCGGAQKAMEMAVDYAKVREQFGRPIGSYQAISHKCANMLIDVEGAKSATYAAAWAIGGDSDEATLAVAIAKAAASDAYRRTAADAVQVHGGIGFTWEHDMHLYFKRSKSSEVAFGDATYNRELVAQMIGL
ncbi:MAG: acyl-CoA dehydrogenase family protein [Candidatus Binataceae bacterium]